MNSSHWKLLLVAMISLGLLVAGGCGPADDSTATDDVTPAESKVLLTGSIGDASYLNPILTSDTTTGTFTGYIFEALVRVDGQVNVHPALATDWTVSDDELVWTFNLRDDVTWHDGEPFTSRDVKFTYDSILHPTYTGPRQGNFNRLIGASAYLQELASITAKAKAEEITETEESEMKMEAYEDWLALEAISTPDDYTVVFRLFEPFAPFLTSSTGLGIVPEHILRDAQGLEMRDHDFSRNPIGTGPWMFNDWRSGEYISVVRNPNHWRVVPQIDELVMKIIPDASTLEVALESAELDVGPIQHESYDQFVDVPHLDIIVHDRFVYTYFGMNLTHPLFEDKTVRHALAHAINKQEMVDEIFQGLALPAHSHGAPTRWDYNPDVAIYDYDPDRARELLAEAGWVAGSDGILEKDGMRFSFTLQTNQGNRARETSAVIIQENLSAVGIEVHLQLVEWSTFVNTVLLAREFEACIVGWSLGVDPDAFSIWHTDGGAYNFVTYSNPRVDELIELGREVSDQDERSVFYAEMQAILAEDLPYVFLFFPDGIQGLNARLRTDGEFMGSPVHSAEMTWNAYEWWIPDEYREGPILNP